MAARKAIKAPTIGRRVARGRMDWSGEIEDAIIDTLSDGGTIKDAAAMAQISLSRIETQMRDNTAFSQRMEKAVAECKMHHIRRIKDGERQWQSSAWFLERRHRDEYSAHATDDPEKRIIYVRRIVRNQLKNQPKQPGETTEVVGVESATEEGEE